MRDGAKAQEYLQVQVLTASQDQLLLMLLDGAVRFVETAREKMERKEREAKNELLLKAQNIILELIQSLDPSVGEKIYANLIGLYKFILRRLLAANVNDDPTSLDEGLKILRNVRETWSQAVAAYRAEKGIQPAASAPASGISLQA